MDTEKLLRIAVFILALILMPVDVAAGQDLPACSTRPTTVELPRVDGRQWCIEQVIDSDEGGELAFTALAFDDEGTLYATRPLTGEVFALHDSDGDLLPDTPEVLITGLQLPNALAFADGVLYIAGDGHLYRWQDDDLETLVDDLPAGRGFYTTGLAISDERLYVAVPAPCDFCIPDNRLHGTVLSFALDGSDRQILARGLRFPAGLTFYDGALWVTDTARDNLDLLGREDEINRIDLASNDVPHFGWPYCKGSNNEPDMQGDFDCETATAPTMSLATYSTPLALLNYTHNRFPQITDELLLVSAGTNNQAWVTGYQIAVIDMQREDGQIIVESILPYDAVVAGVDRIAYDTKQGYDSVHSRLLNIRGAGVWPHRLYSIAVSPDGWLFFSAGGGQIYALRDADRNPCDFVECKAD